MKHLYYILTSLLLLFTPIFGITVAVGAAISLDTITGVFRSIKLGGIKEFRSRRLSNVASKMALYGVCVVFLYIIDKGILNEFVKHAFGFDYMFTKICAIVLIFTELVSIKENIEEAFNIDIWKLLTDTFNRAKEIRSDINEITK